MSNRLWIIYLYLNNNILYTYNIDMNSINIKKLDSKANFQIEKYIKMFDKKKKKRFTRHTHWSVGY